MKKLLFVGILIILTFTTCTKDLGIDETFALKQLVPESMFSLIKAWHEKKIAVNETLLNSSNTSTTNQTRKVTLMPDYEHATFETIHI